MENEQRSPQERDPSPRPSSSDPPPDPPGATIGPNAIIPADKSDERKDETDTVPVQVTQHTNNQVRSVMLYGVPIVALVIDGKERLCLAQISNTLLKGYSYNEIHNRRVALGITCVQCTPVQLEILRRAGAMPISSRRCGMITKREADRLCKSFLGDISPPKLPENFAFDVYHECSWGCRGSFYPSRYNSSRAKCVKCGYCNVFFSPNKFIFHSHRMSESKYQHPDAANFNSWRRHMKLAADKPSEDLVFAWEDVKAMFNGGNRKRVSSSHSPHNVEAAKKRRLEQESHMGELPHPSPAVPSFPVVPVPNRSYSLQLQSLPSNMNIPHTVGTHPSLTPGVPTVSRLSAANVKNAWGPKTDGFEPWNLPWFNGMIPPPLLAAKSSFIDPPLAATDLLKNLRRPDADSSKCLAKEGPDSHAKRDDAAPQARITLGENGRKLLSLMEQEQEHEHTSAFRPVIKHSCESCKATQSSACDCVPSGSTSHNLHEYPPAQAAAENNNGSGYDVDSDARSYLSDINVTDDCMSDDASDKDHPSGRQTIAEGTPPSPACGDNGFAEDKTEATDPSTLEPAVTESEQMEDATTSSHNDNNEFNSHSAGTNSSASSEGGTEDQPETREGPGLTPPHKTPPPTCTETKETRGDSPTSAQNKQPEASSLPYSVGQLLCASPKSKDSGRKDSLPDGAAGVTLDRNSTVSASPSDESDNHEFEDIRRQLATMTKEELERELSRQREARQRIEKEYRILQDTFQEQVKRELTYRQEMVEQIRLIRDTLCQELDQERRARLAVQQKLKEAHDALHHFSCKMLASQHCNECSDK
ncbi:PREDICTED: SKI family transcriptional corepressor 1 homolog-B-like [Branchiostoma belcheri]|uniref:SKI family transcriptional corepressor 1 homolog-B-like n=1 Tax=Branchiostoma belcheri TaxID=7741 RepID=A0A6P4YP56_BRABE|nr:PREDICTED: SKI family transcriptional corepressor 1 homolog-B-like [Branchiostoma belcheri]